MKLLALDCSTQACSVALLNSGTTANHEILDKYELTNNSHTERLLPMIDEVLAQAQYSLSEIDVMAFGCGPGSFTGLRICVGAVQGLAFGMDLPVIPISSLAALAQRALQEGKCDQLIEQAEVPLQLLSTIDARMEEIYWGVYTIADGLVTLQGQEMLTAPEQVRLPSSEALPRTTFAVGSGMLYEQRIPCIDQMSLTNSQLLPHAAAVARLAHREMLNNNLYCAHQALPVYLRDQVAWKKPS